jgi:hypothetical protein
VLLSSWLFRTTVYVCRNFRRMAARRDAHERKAARMHSEIQEPSSPPPWEQLSARLNQAVESLGQKDRDAILLRYFERKDVVEVGTTLGISEAAARKRISRAVDRLGAFFRSQGIDAPAATIDASLLAGAVCAAPPGLREAVMSVVSAPAAASAPVVLAKGVLFMTLKTKSIIAAAVLVLLLGAGAFTVVHMTPPLLADGAAPVQAMSQPVRASTWTRLTPKGISAELIAVSAMPDSSPPGTTPSVMETALGKLTGRQPVAATIHPADVAWFSPDGSPLDQLPDVEPSSVFLNSSNVYRFVVNIDAKNDVDIAFDAPGGGSRGSSYSSSSGHGPLRGVFFAVLPTGAKTFSFRVGFASGDWTTVCSTTRPAVESAQQVDGTTGGTIAFKALDQSTSPASVETIERPGIGGRLIAIADGKIYVGSVRNSFGTAGMSSERYEFRGAPVGRIERLEFQTRPYDEWLEFKNIAIPPMPAN